MGKTLQIDISGIHYDIDEKTESYAKKKVAKLVDYIPRQARPSAFANIKITQVNQKNNNKYECEIVLTLPEKVLVAKDYAPNALAAIDVVESKLRGQIRRYKTERRADGVRTGGIIAKLKKSLRRK
ncbi:ribosome-associated translation inhibitor RaiA [Candidatus Saccharibacteria bacterium]|nr:ribosome-associated translation inhibitor RaiA [Candidatus Saccharibacteria bacterium]MCL1962850.1 ribosome-associated translation inhibitor RaiA [Candidatus Saccharibacteria bacterium]